MANDVLPPGWVMTADGPIREEQQAIREQLGTAGRRLTEEEIAESGARRAEAAVFDDPLQTFAERALGAATFGLSDVFAGSETQYERGRRVEFNPLAATAGTLTGSVVPGLLSGGTGTVGTLARLTPAGRVAALSNRVAAAGGLGRAVAGGAVEGVAGAVGDYVSRVALDDDVEFSADALVSSALTGGALGGALGGLGVVGAKGAKKAEASLGELLESRAAAKAAQAPAGKVRTASLFRKAKASRSVDDLRGVGSELDSLATRQVAKEADDLEAILRASPNMSRAETGALAKLRELDVKREAALQSARQSFGKYADETGLSQLGGKVSADDAARALKEASDETLDEVSTAIAGADKVERDINKIMSDLRARAETLAPGSTANVGRVREDGAHVGPLAAALNGIKTATEAPRAAFGRALDVGATAAGALEVAGTAGVDVPRLSDVVDIGPLGSLWLQGKVGLKALKKSGGYFPASKATGVASKIGALDDSLRSGALRAVRRVAKAAQSPAAVLTPARAAAALADLARVDPAVEAQAVADGLAETTASVQAAAAARAQRAVEYLQTKAPRDPLPNRPATARKWEPNAAQVLEFQRKARTVADVAWGIDRVLTAGDSFWEAEALREVYPAMYRALGQHVLDNLDEFQKTHSVAELAQLGIRLGIPTTVDTTPGYSYKPAAPLPSARPAFTRPSTPGASPSAQAEKVE